MLMSKGVAHALDYDIRRVPPAVMATLQRAEAEDVGAPWK